jgi:hypothetical protein
MKKFMKECGECQGNGYTYTNSTYDKDPQYDVSYECNYCDCEGQVQDSEAINEAIEDAQWMIDGMITRLRLTSDNIMLCAKLDCHNLVARYKHRISIQAKALARLEMYKANLQNL